MTTMQIIFLSTFLSFGLNKITAAVSVNWFTFKDKEHKCEKYDKIKKITK